jgi:hypothetical protein
MTMTANATFTCDRDGAVAGPVNTAPNMPGFQLPEGWSRFNVDRAATPESGTTTSTGHLCPACSAAFVEFMAAMGQGQNFKPPA